MTLAEVMLELEALGNERIKKQYIGRGAHEPLYGVATGAMKPLLKKIKKDRSLGGRYIARCRFHNRKTCSKRAHANRKRECHTRR